MAEEEYYRSGTAKYTQSAINQKAPLMYTTNRLERCTQDLENRKSFLAIKAAHILMSSHTFQREEL